MLLMTDCSDSQYWVGYDIAIVVIGLYNFQMSSNIVIQEYDDIAIPA